MARSDADPAVQLRKGMVEIAVLALLKVRPRYGGELVEALDRYAGLETAAGTIYPLLTRLKTAGWVQTTWQESPSGPPRKYYELTASGEQRLTTLRAAYSQLSNALNTLLEEER